MKILYYGECPYIETGYAQVAKHILPVLASKGHVSAVFHSRNVEVPADCPYTIIEARPLDTTGAICAQARIKADDYDLLFIISDLHLLSGFSEAIQARKSQHAKVVIYAAIDTTAIYHEQVAVLHFADEPIVFSFFAQKAIQKVDSTIPTRVIYHGCEPDVFYPLADPVRRESRESMFHCGPETYIVACFNRNQPRKDLPRMLYAFRLFHEKHHDSLLYIHACINDVGGQLIPLAYAMGLNVDEYVRFAPSEVQDNYAHGVSRSWLNTLYNCADLCVSTTTGEGFGLCTTEAMAAGTPFIGPRNTTFPEILGENGERGLLANFGGPDLWCSHWEDGPREMVSVTSVIEKMEEAYQGRHDRTKAQALAARNWTKQHTWASIQDKWTEVLDALVSNNITVDVL